VLSASAGTGHVRCGDALREAFVRDGRVAEVRHEDALEHCTRLFRELYSDLYTRLVRSAPTLLGLAYHVSDEPWRNEALRLRFDRLNTQPLVRLLRDFAPDVVVCTHFMPAGLVAGLLARGEFAGTLSIVVTDFDCHAMWLTRVFHRYFVALGETRAHLEALGFPADRITASGIPVSAAFGHEVDRSSVLGSMGLDPGRRTVLASAGALGVGPMELLVERLCELEDSAQVVVVCGRSEPLRSRIAGMVRGRPGFRVLGYSTRIHKLMRSCDVLVGKPGGMTSSDALACGLPMVVVAPIPGQEERNSDHLLEEGVAIRCNEMTSLPYKLGMLLKDPDRLAAMAARALRMGRPEAARCVVQQVLEDADGGLLPEMFGRGKCEESALATARG